MIVKKAFCAKWWLICLQIVGMAMVGSGQTTPLVKEVETVFRESVLLYFELVSKRDMRALTVFDEITAENFSAYIRDERQLHRKEWRHELERYFITADWTYKYEIEKVSVEMLSPNKAVVRVQMTEVRVWRDSEGVFGSIGQQIQVIEPLEADFVFTKRDGVWKWETFARYGLDKRAMEQKKDGDLQ